MIRIGLALSFLLLSGLAPGARPAAGQSLYETRAVWLATILQDGGWPDTRQSAAEQQAALEALLDRAAGLGMNTLYFQVIARGDALYPSTRLPWTPLPRGAGRDPGYDPLAAAIDAAHRRGMEIHAWINIFRVGDASTTATFRGVQNPMHVVHAQPDWVKRVGGELWLDPSSAPARAWMLGNVMEVVDGYDVDGVHFDFIRYPENGLPNDAARFRHEPRGFRSIDDWRRNNVTLFVEAAHAAVTAARPWVKIGAAPLGNYQPNPAWPGLWAVSQVFQESRVWAENGWVDYLAPQLYYGTGTAPEVERGPSSPDFAVLIDEWVRMSAGRPVIAGMAPYKVAEGRFPAADLSRQIEVARAAYGHGQAAFRFDHMLEHAGIYRAAYVVPALPAPMAHRFEAAPPSTPRGFRVEASQNGAVALAWARAEGSAEDPLRGYALFRREGAVPDPTSGRDLVAVLPATATTYSDANADAMPAGRPVYYLLAALSRLGMASAPTEAVSTGPITTTERPTGGPRWALIESIFPNPSQETAEVRYAVGSPGPVTLSVVDALGRVRYRHTGLASRAGIDQHMLDTTRLAAGVYQVVLEAGGRTARRAFVVVD
ncbi:MAG: family 10 glycosylhydrolase [Rhodothermales bacterium]|nr:family 10 glycosylhydrolase [Rhodothermales bacterium]